MYRFGLLPRNKIPFAHQVVQWFAGMVIVISFVAVIFEIFGLLLRPGQVPANVG